MDPKQRRQLIIGLISSEAILFAVLLSSGLWGALILVLLAEGLIGLLVFLRLKRGVPLRLGRGSLWIAAAVIVLLLILALTVGANLYTEWLWFDELGYGTVFGTRLGSRVLLFVAAGLLATLFLGGNIHLALRWLPRRHYLDDQKAHLVNLWKGRIGPIAGWIGAALIGLLGFGSFFQGKWMHYLRFLNAETIGQTDPLFGRDLSFYLYRLHFLLDLRNALLWLTALGLILAAVIYGIGLQKRRFPPLPLAHLSVLGIFFLLVKVWDYRLKIAMLVYSEHGAAYGAGYTDVHARWPAYNILTYVVAGCILLLLVNLWRRTWVLLIAGGGVWVVSLLLAGTIYPALVQSFRVNPSELALERPYIEYNIASTLAAYGLDEIEETDYPVQETLTAAMIEENRGTIDNIRLWDHRPLYNTYGQLQEIRLYYDFVDIDVERYTLGGEYREVEMAVRELSVDQLTEQAQTWVNRHLIYTHGYGVVLSPVNEICAEGQPCFLIRDVPPQSEYPELQIDRPEIYYGEDTGNYVIVGTTTDEFDYPSGSVNQFTRYEGEGGVPIGSFTRRLAFALRFGDLPILVSSYITPDSRILLHRTIQDRVDTIAPFLWYDYDPYPVILDGRLYWIQDAYTLSDRYPYSQPYQELNYARNAVKVVIDAYSGSATFYVVDPDDPMVQVYARIFPELFRPVEEMPEGLREHWRYPEELFRIQSHIYATYHMADPQVFYNREDAWDFAREIYLGQEGSIDSYYVIMRLPGWEDEEFFLMVPFTPANRDNMIAWMHVQCDGDDYGRLGVYNFPKQTLIYGPFQIEARIDQDPVISQQLTLWNQRGSQVIRGNLLVVPIDNNLLYVEPLYLQAQSGQIPELQRVTVAYANHIAMAPTLEEALQQVLASGITVPTGDRTWEEVARSAQEHFERAQECLQAGDWNCYGEELDALEQDLQELIQLSDTE